MRILLGLALVTLALAGCADKEDFHWAPEAAWTPDPCDPQPNPRISANAPVARPYDVSLERFIKRLAEAMGDPLSLGRVGAHPSIGAEDSQPVWTTGHGVIWYYGGTSLRVESERAWPPLNESQGKAALEEFLSRMGRIDPPPVITYEVSTPSDFQRRARFTVAQDVPGGGRHVVMEGTVQDSTGNRFVSMFTFERPRQLPRTLALSDEEVGRIAGEFLSCIDPDREEPLSPDGFTSEIVHGSLVRTVIMARGGDACRGGATVQVDAATGAIHGFRSGTGISCRPSLD